MTERMPPRPAPNLPSLIDSPRLRAQAEKLRDLAEESEEGPLRAALLQIAAWYEKAAQDVEHEDRGPG